MNTTKAGDDFIGQDFIQLPKFNTCLVVGDKVSINEGIGTILFIRGGEITLSANGLRWTIQLTDIHTFKHIK